MFVILHKKIFLAIAAVLMLGSAVIVGTLGINLGIDFTGGSLSEVGYEVRPDKTELTIVIDTLDLGGYSLRETVDETGRDGYILRTKDLTESERQSVESALLSVGEGAELSRFTSIGPVIGQELKSKAVWAIGGVALIIILYVAIAFAGVGYPVGSWVYGGITILALIHDILVPAAVMSILGVTLGVEADVLFVMAILAVLGYSVNDTIVVFDRVRENLTQYTKVTPAKAPKSPLETPAPDHKELQKPFAEIVGMSVEETLIRSINTSVTTLIALGTLFVFGGEVTKTFTLVLIAGVLAGTYSSICLANPLLVLLGERALAKTKK